jgi:hypothetical protein
MVTGSCHCGAVRITVTLAPATFTSCNCSICRRLGTLWAYYRPRQVTVTGDTATYVWGDRMLALHHCATCGCTTHWESIETPPRDRMGINVRLLDLPDFDSIPLKLNDGASY